MKTYKIKSLDIQAKEYFDKVNGNSYFSAIITLNFGLNDQKNINIPFQYGYGTFYEYAALQKLQSENFISGKVQTLWKYSRDKNIILKTSKKEKCLKSEVKNFAAY
jgi:hypothetical protein